MIRSAVIVFIVSYLSFKLYSWYISIVIDQPEEAYDFIIVGGGTTGAVIAARLSEVASFRVLVLEAGSEDGYDPRILIPALNPFSLGAAHDWKYTTKSKAGFSKMKKNNTEEIPRGKILGGTSNLNFHLYVRGSKQDYDSWADNGAADWNYDRIKRYFIKSEKSNHIYDIDEGYHGSEGPLHVSHLKKMPSTDMFLDAAEEVGLSYGDNNGESNLGAAVAQTTVKDGVRQSSVKAYLRPAVHSRRNRLHVVTDAHVTKVLFRGIDNGRHQAIGVQYVKNGKKMTVKAKREVILSAGAYGTPHILMLSGLGPRQHLESKGIPVIQDLPGIGSNLQDHPFLPISFYANNLSYGDVGGAKEVLYSLPDYLLRGTGPLGANGIAFATMPVSDSKQDGKGPQRLFQNVFLPFETDTSMYTMMRQEMACEDGVFDKEMEAAKRERNGVLFSFFMFTSIMNPRSRGIVRLNTTDPFDHPIIRSHIFSDPEDLEDAIKGVKWTMDLMKTEAFKKIEPEFINLHGECSGKEKESRELYECIAKAETQLFHGCCTAKIGGLTDKFAVVDPQLRVYGIDGLRVADASVMPTIVSAPMQATCYMIGEKAADLIKEHWSNNT